METSGLHRPKVSFEFLVVIVFLAVLTFRILVIIGTLRADYLNDGFRVGVVPWSDAQGWVEGANQILRGEQISGMATCRPLYSLFLSVVFFIVRSSYLGAIYAQVIFSAFVITAAYYLLKPVDCRLSVLLFLTFLTIWRPEEAARFMTEDLGICILILGFALLWRGTSNGCNRSRFSGLFFLGLSEAVRPWCIMTLATVPFFCFFASLPLKAKFKSFVLHVLFISLGFGLHAAADRLFNKDGERYANNLQTLYGQVTGGRGWTSVFSDPLIMEAFTRNGSADENNHILLSRIVEIFHENPLLFAKASIDSYWFYLKTIPDAFRHDRKMPAFFVLLFLLFSVADIQKHLPAVSKIGLYRLRIVVILIPTVFLFIFYYAWFWTFLSLIGLGYVICRPKRQLNAFVLLYFGGILLTLPLVGKDGGLRVKIGSDILIYLLAALGSEQVMGRLLSALFERQISSDPDPRPPFFGPVRLAVAAVTIFLVIPCAIRFGHRSVGDSSILEGIGPEEVAARLNLEEIPLDPKTIEEIWNRWPNPSIERMDGRLAYYSVRFSDRNAICFDANRGFSGMSPYTFALHWPLSPVGFKRTVLILERWYTLFPNSSIEDLHFYEDREIVVVGHLIAKSRPWPYKYTTAFVLNVTHIISIDESGNLKETPLSLVSGS